MFNKNKITLETRENKLEKIKKKGLRKTLFTTVMSMGMLLGCTGMLVGCGEAGTKGDTGATGPAGPQGVAGSSFLTDEGVPASAYGANGDVYLDTTTFNLYKKVDGVWTELGNIKGEPGEPGATPTIDISEDGYWIINGVTTDQKAQGVAGETGQAGKGIQSITSAYEYDYTTNIEYYVFTFTYTDDTTEEKRVEIPKKINSVAYIGESTYNITEIGSEPTLKIKVTYENSTTEEINITEEMYIVDDIYSKPNFQVAGNYNVKISYRGVITTFNLNIIDPSQQQEFVITADKYKNLQKFSHWEDEQGNTVSEELTYSYYAASEINYEAVYVDFIELDGVLLDDGTYIDTNNKYISTNGNGWLVMGYLTESLTKGMYVEFTINKTSATKQLLWGISTKEYVEDYNTSPTTKGWLTNDTTGGMNKLFVAEYNMYSGMEGSTREDFSWLSKIENVGKVEEGKTAFTDASIDMATLIKDNNTIKIKFVLDDQLLMYVNDQLFTASNMPDWAINDSKEYYLSFAGSTVEMSISDIGIDEYIENRGNFSTLTTNPLEKEDFSGKTITFLGDSITEGVGVSDTSNRYSSVLASSLGMTENNMGVSGTVLCTGGHRTSRLDDIQTISYDSDYVGILLGVNDFDQCKNDGTSQYYSLGEFGSDDTTTIYGALDKMCSDLVNRFRSTDTKIFMMTPVVTSWNNSVSSTKEWDNDKLNAWGYSLRDLCDAIEEVATYYGIVTLDLNEECVMTETDFSDGIHPNDSGAQKMADTIEEFLLANFSYK